MPELQSVDVTDGDILPLAEIDADSVSETVGDRDIVAHAEYDSVTVDDTDEVDVAHNVRLGVPEIDTVLLDDTVTETEVDRDMDGLPE